MAVWRCMFVWALAALVSLTAASTSSAVVVEACGETFFDEVVGYDRPVLVEFYTTSCPVCKRMAPVVEELSAELADKVKVVKVNTRESAGLSMQFDIKNVPTFIYFDNGNVMKRHIGGNTREGLMSLAGMPAQSAETRKLPEPPKPAEAPRPAEARKQDAPQPQAPPKPDPAPASAEVREVCDENFFHEVVGYGRPVVVEFYSPSCPVCKKMTPVLEEFSAGLAGKVKVVKVNTRDSLGLSSQFEIKNVPTFVYFENGNIMRRHIGGSSQDGLKRIFGIQQ
ncbi:MAG: thioredoxin family protein [Nitrospirae bacterium]|nr:thioredoxin family protein [Nitrospirota bacterium]